MTDATKISLKTKTEKSVGRQVDLDLCCGCGFCAPSCPHDVITMVLDDNLEYRPKIDFVDCTACMVCQIVCPFDAQNIYESFERSHAIGQFYGYQNVSTAIQGSASDDVDYYASPAGGLLSTLLTYMLENSHVDAVIHGTPANHGDTGLYYEASVSRSASELNGKRASIYTPIEFSSAITEVAEDPTVKKIAFVGVPCAVTAIKKLFVVNKNLSRKKLYTLALVCSHNTSAQFANILANDISSGKNTLSLNFRDKRDIPNKEDFGNTVALENGSEITKSRFDSNFTDFWRSYAFSWNCCLYCDDFTGVNADASFKDAWGLGVSRTEGETVVLIRNSELAGFFKDAEKQKQIEIKDISVSHAAKSQTVTQKFKGDTLVYRMGSAYPRLRTRMSRRWHQGPKRLLQAIELQVRRATSKSTKWLYRKKLRQPPRKLLWLIAKGYSFVGLLTKIFDRVAGPNQSKYRPYHIVYAAGFGYDNLGDEAQVHGNILEWRELRPNSKITLLSPNPEQTSRTHGDTVDVIDAPRTSFWSLTNSPYLGVLSHRVFFPVFLVKYLYLVVTIALYRIFGITFLLSPESARILEALLVADVLHIGGGGFITGKTSSRLYDMMALIAITRLLGTPVIMSGQTIGIWRNPLQRLFAMHLHLVSRIGLRDHFSSVEDITSLGLKEQRLRLTFDDALFCPGMEEDTLAAYWRENMRGNERKYIAINLHFWELDKLEVRKTFASLAKTVSHFSISHNLDLVLVPMSPTDNEALEVFEQELTVPCHILRCQGNFKLAISAFRNAEICISQKHHPLVFANSGLVPSISFFHENYYRHKNIGAMKLFGQEKYVVEAKVVETGHFGKLLEDIYTQRQEISDEIAANIRQLRKNKSVVIREFLEHRWKSDSAILVDDTAWM